MEKKLSNVERQRTDLIGYEDLKEDMELDLTCEKL